MILSILLAAGLLASPCNAHPVYGLAPVESHASVRRAGHGYQAQASLSFRIVEKRPAVITSVDPGLLAHVRGHQLIAQRVAKAANGTVRATGSTAAQARARLKQALAQMTHDQQNELDREERIYDSVTNGGAAQSQAPQYGFPGGPDAHDPCVQQ